LAQACSRILLYKVSTTYTELPSNEPDAGLKVVSPPMQGSARLGSEKTDGSNTVVYIERKNNPRLLLFTTSANHVYVENNKVNIYQVNDKQEKTAEATF
jgi:hypothetical protein